MDKTYWETEEYNKWQNAGYPIVHSIRGLKLKGVDNIPEEIRNLTGLFDLSLKDSRLTSLPDSISRLIHLKGLVINNTGLDTLPDSIVRLTNLEKLDLDRNLLTTLPETIGNLTNLTYLYVSNNYLEVLPNSIGDLRKLRYLYLDNNELESLPNSIGNLTNLADLFFEFNRFYSLPNSIFKLTNLFRIHLKNNPYEFPIEIDKFKNFKNLNKSSSFNLNSEIEQANKKVILADPYRKQERAVSIALMRPLQKDQELAKAQGKSFETRSIPGTKDSNLPELPRDLIMQLTYGYQPAKSSDPPIYDDIIANSKDNNILEAEREAEAKERKRMESESSEAKGGKKKSRRRSKTRRSRTRRSRRSRTRRINKK
jgi:hypothetical protein